MFNEYPYVNLQDVNLDWILKNIKELETNLQDFVKLNTIKYADPIIWNITKQYETNTVVIDGNTGTAYLSVQPVPAGVALTNTDYWTVVFTLNLTTSNQNITFRDDGTNVVATFASDTGDWILWNFYLYRVTQPISVNTAYVEGFNIERYSVELFIKDYINDLKAIVGELTDLTTTDKDSIVDAINELVTSIGNVDTKVGDLADLTTTDKDSIVDAINELVTSIGNVATALNNYKSYMSAYVTPEMFGAIGDGVADDTQAILDAIAAGSVCLCSKTYKTTQPIIPATRKTLIINGSINYTGNDCAIKLVNNSCMLDGIGNIIADSPNGIYISGKRNVIKNITVSMNNGIFVSAINIDGDDHDIVLTYIEKVKLYSYSSDNYYGVGLYIHTAGNGYVNENYFSNISASFFEDGLKIYNNAVNALNRNKFVQYDAEGCTRHLYAYSGAGSYIIDNDFDFRVEEFGTAARIYIDKYVQQNKFRGRGFRPQNFSVINPDAKTLYTASTTSEFNLIEGFVMSNGASVVGYNGAFHLNGDVVAFDRRSAYEGAVVYNDITIDYSNGLTWPLSLYKIGGPLTTWVIDLNYRSDWCTAPIERIQVQNSAGTDVTIKNGTTILYGPTHLNKGMYRVMYDTATKTSISLEQITVA